MRVIAAIALSIAIFPAPAKAQEPLTFSNPPDAVPDFLSWDSRRSDQVLTPAAAGQTLAYEFRRAGLCRSDEPSCRVRVLVEEYARWRCIAQDGSENDCRRRLAYRSKTTVAVAIRYVMVRGDLRREGIVHQMEDDPMRFFDRKEGAWHEIMPEVDEREYELQKSLYFLFVQLPTTR